MDKSLGEEEYEPPICPYCQIASQRIGGKELYPHRPDLYALVLYRCQPCDAYVGCHKGTAKPLGRLANAELRMLRVKAHASFDPLWKDGGMTRSEAYAWLAKELGLEIKLCHIGLFDEEYCQRVVTVCAARVS